MRGDTGSTPATTAERLRARATAKVGDERGTMTVFALFLFLAMLLVAGMTIDFMRAEMARSKLQYTLDRAVLAAASLAQEREQEAVVRDYLRAAGLEGQRVVVDPPVAGSGRTVSARAAGAIDTLFLRMVGVDTIAVPASAAAAERASHVEMSLVLDMSGSMKRPSGRPGETRMEAMRTAAKAFVDRILEGSEDTTMVSLVPYGAQVDLGPTYGPYFPFDWWHRYSSCARFEVSDYLTTAVLDSSPIRQLASFQLDPFDGVPWDGDVDGQVNSRCSPTQPETILWSNDVKALQDRIDEMVAKGGTGTDVATKWGVTFLDPSSAPRLDAMAGAGLVDPRFRGRPARYDDPDTMKVLVLMTDGLIDEKYGIKDSRSSGLSGVYAWRADFGSLSAAGIAAAIDADVAVRTSGETGSTDRLIYSIRDRADDTVFYHAYEGGTPETGPKGGAEAVELTYGQLWALKSPGHVYVHMARGTPEATHGWYRDAREIYHETRPDRGKPLTRDNLAAICSAAKAAGGSSGAGIRIFTIGFKVSGQGITDMRDCASGAADFYEIQTADLEYAFDQIARSITRLTLTR